LYSRPMRTLGPVILAALACGGLRLETPIHARSMGVTVRRVPDAGVQPQAAADPHGAVHLVYFRGEPAHGDAFYIYSRDGGSTFPRLEGVAERCTSGRCGWSVPPSSDSRKFSLSALPTLSQAR